MLGPLNLDFLVGSGLGSVHKSTGFVEMLLRVQFCTPFLVTFRQIHMGLITYCAIIYIVSACMLVQNVWTPTLYRSQTL